MSSKRLSSFIRLIKFLVGKARQGTLLQSAARWLRSRGFLFFPMSWEAYRFDEYRRARWRKFDVKDLRQLDAGGKPGLVSIVLPAYNGEAFIHEAVDSVLGQAYPNWEVIAVDDGSTDQSGKILDEYALKDKRIRVIHQENKKLPAALNRGFAEARGEYYTWISCDNRMHPDFLEKMVDCLNRYPGWDMVYANIDLIGSDGTLLDGSAEYVTYQFPYGSAHIHLPVNPAELNIVPNNIIGPAFLYRRRAAFLIGEYHSHVFTVEDYDFWMRLNALLHIRHVPFADPVYDYRFHPGSLTGRKEDLQIVEIRKKLLVFDHFRRDFYLMPCLYTLQSSSSEQAEKFAAAFRTLLKAVGDIFEVENAWGKVPKAGLPALQVQIITTSDVHPSFPVGEKVGLKALVVVGEGEIPELLPEGWDVHILVNPSKPADFNLHGPPSSWLIVPDVHNLRLVLDILARTFALEVLLDLAKTTESSRQATVVVCTHYRAKALQNCLASLAEQDYPPQDFEVVVVNNAPTGSQAYQEVSEVIKKARDSLYKVDPGHFRSLDCPVPGLSISRNVALAASRGEIFCSIDDDAVAEKDWLSKLVSAFANDPDLGVAGGKMLLEDPLPQPWWYRPVWRRFWSHFAPPYMQYTVVKTWEQFPWGGNWAARRQTLREIGGFFTRYGRSGSNLLGGEETIVTCLAQSLGYSVGVEPQAVVHHQVEPSRFTLRYVMRNVRSSRKTWYSLQKEGYIAWEMSLGHSLIRIGQSFSHFRSESFIKVFYTTFSEFSAWGWLWIDFFRRFRKYG